MVQRAGVQRDDGCAKITDPTTMTTADFAKVGTAAIDANSNGMDDATELAECAQRAIEALGIDPVVREAMEEVKEGTRSIREVEEEFRPSCNGNEDQPMTKNQIMIKLEQMEDRTAAGAKNGYEACEERAQHNIFGLAGAEPALNAGMTEDDCDFITMCGDGEKRREATTAAVKTIRRRMRKQRQLSVMNERRRQLKEEPARKLTTEEVEADKWYIRGVRYLVATPQPKVSHKQRKALNNRLGFLEHKLKKKLRAHP